MSMPDDLDDEFLDPVERQMLEHQASLVETMDKVAQMLQVAIPLWVEIAETLKKEKETTIIRGPDGKGEKSRTKIVG